MSWNEYTIADIFMELIRVLIISEYFTIFNNVKNNKVRNCICIISYIMTLVCYIFFNNMAVNLVISLMAIFLIGCTYSGSLKKTILLSVMCYAIQCASDVIAVFLFTKLSDNGNYELVSMYLSVLLFYIIVIVLKNVYKKQVQEEFSGQWSYLLISAICSICILYMIANDTGMARITIVVTGIVVLAVNIMLYRFYVSMSDRFIYEQDNILLRKQMDIYEQQISANVENAEKIRAIRHDMKHHIREIKELSEKGMTKEINEYIDMLAGDINEAQSYIDTGNAALDGIVNYYMSVAATENIIFDTNISVPQNMQIKTYDLNIIMGNLLDNAFENTMMAKNKQVLLKMKYFNSILYISSINTYTGAIKKTGEKFISLKDNSHGYGVDNIKRIVNKYNGNIEIDYKNNIFNISIMLYIGEME
jgi:two-component system sensor histidine kinase AgrC